MNVGFLSLLTRFAFLLSLSNPNQSWEKVERKITIRAVGTAEIYATGVKSGVEMMIFFNEKGRSSAIIKWDNQSLFGTAWVCSKQVVKSKDGSRHIYFQGEFDCSNLGGWPEDTWSYFDLQIYGFNGVKDFEAFYRIQGNSRLTKQVGKLKRIPPSNPIFFELFCPARFAPKTNL